MILEFSLSLLFLALRIHGREVNVTIDDQYGDPTTGQAIQYSPPEAWQSAQDCGDCTAKPRPISNAYNSTWTDGSFFPAGSGPNGVSGQIISASVPFIGTAVYVQVILSGSVSSPNANSDFTFYIDNVTSGVFQRAPNGDKTYQFNQTVFSKNGLSNSLHTLGIDSGHAGQKSLVLLDSIIYTKELQDNTSNSTDPNPETQSNSSSNIGAIVGPVVGGIIAAGAIFALIFFLRQRRQQQDHQVRVLSCSPPMEPTSSAPPGHPGNLGLSHTMSQIDPFITSLNTTTAHSNSDASVERSAGGVPGPGAATHSSGLNTRPHYFAGNHEVTSYDRVNESQMAVNPALPPPPAYRKVDTFGLPSVSR